jgi:hypothetical protein
MLRAILAAAAVAGVLTLPSVALAEKPCANMAKGPGRTACLKAEIERGRQEIERNNQRTRNYDKATDVICAGREVGGVAARIAGGTVAGPGGANAAEAVATGSTFVGDYAAGNTGACAKRAR